MQSVLSRIWTRVAVSISYDYNHYTTGTHNTDIVAGNSTSLYALHFIFSSMQDKTTSPTSYASDTKLVPGKLGRLPGTILATRRLDELKPRWSSVYLNNLSAGRDTSLIFKESTAGNKQFQLQITFLNTIELHTII